MSSARISGGVLLAIVPVMLAISGCNEKERSDGSLTRTCQPSTSATGKETRVSHPSKPSECKFGVILFCNACVYDDKGGLSHSASEPCGVCIGTKF